MFYSQRAVPEKLGLQKFWQFFSSLFRWFESSFHVISTSDENFAPLCSTSLQVGTKSGRSILDKRWYPRFLSDQLTTIVWPENYEIEATVTVRGAIIFAYLSKYIFVFFDLPQVQLYFQLKCYFAVFLNSNVCIVWIVSINCIKYIYTN